MAGSARLTDSALESRRGVPEFLGRPGPSAVHRLNPLTKATLATVTAIAAVVLGGLVGPAILVTIAVIGPALIAGVIGQLARLTLLLSLPIAISALLVNVFFFPGGTTVLFNIGPVTATAEGLAFALEILARILAISGAVTLFYLTTRPSDFVIDLERRGVSPRIGFVAQCIGPDGAGNGRARGTDHRRAACSWPGHRGLGVAPRPRDRPDRRPGGPRLDRRGRGARDGPRGPRLRPSRATHAAVGAA